MGDSRFNRNNKRFKPQLHYKQLADSRESDCSATGDHFRGGWVATTSDATRLRTDEYKRRAWSGSTSGSASSLVSVLFLEFLGRLTKWSCEVSKRNMVVAPESHIEGKSFDSEFISKFGQGNFFTFNFYEKSLSSVSVLLRWATPSAIFRGIVPIVVDTVYRMLGRWPKPHISKKIFKFIPSITNLNTSTAIVPKSFLARIATALTYTQPRFVFSCVSSAVSSAAVLTYLSRQATTALSMTRSKVPCRNDDFFAAPTLTKPIAPKIYTMRKTTSSKTTELLTRNINGVHFVNIHQGS